MDGFGQLEPLSLLSSSTVCHALATPQGQDGGSSPDNRQGPRSVRGERRQTRMGQHTHKRGAHWVEPGGSTQMEGAMERVKPPDQGTGLSEEVAFGPRPEEPEEPPQEPGNAVPSPAPPWLALCPVPVPVPLSPLSYQSDLSFATHSLSGLGWGSCSQNRVSMRKLRLREAENLVSYQ